MRLKKDMNNIKSCVSDYLKGNAFVEEDYEVDIDVYDKLIGNRIITSKDLNLNDNENFIIMLYLNDILEELKQDPELDLENKIIKLIETAYNRTDDKFHTYHIVCYAMTYKEKKIFQDMWRYVRYKAKGIFDCGTVANINYIVIQLANKDISQPLIVNIESRLTALRMPYKNTDDELSTSGIHDTVQSYVFTAKLFDIVEIYNLLGDVLFAKNLRYKINDKLGVEGSILDTLENHPKDFWYLNNGITMVVSDRRNLQLNENNRLKLKFHESGDISIINGAQTISTAANFFYKDITGLDSELKERKERERLRACNNAQVLFRVVYMKENSEYSDSLDKISIALNRQKPITIEDIEYTREEIASINDEAQHKSDKTKFKITKRGEHDSKISCYNLPEFVRAVTAYYKQTPGSARSKSSRELISSVLSWDELQEISSFFDKIFMPLNFAVKLLKTYDDDSKSLIKDDEKNAIIKNGRYYFMSFICYVLNDGKETYASFEYSLPSNCEKLIDSFAELCLSNFRHEKQILIPTSNDFKNEVLYNKLKDDKSKEMEDFKNTIKATFCSDEDCALG